MEFIQYEGNFGVWEPYVLTLYRPIIFKVFQMNARRNVILRCLFIADREKRPTWKETGLYCRVYQKTNPLIL